MKGYFYAFAGATLWGLSSVCSGFLMTNYAITPLQLTLMRPIVATTLFGIFVFARYKSQINEMLSCKDLRNQMILFGIALFLCQCNYILAINYSNPGTATVMQSLNIVLVPIFTWALHKAKLRLFEIVSAGMAFGAVVAIATQGTIASLSMPFWGLFWGLACGLSETLYVMCPSKLFARWDSIPVTAMGMTIASAVAIIVNVGYSCITHDASAFYFPRLDIAGWLAMGGVCILGTFVAFGLFLRGLSYVGPIITSLLGAMEPLSSAILSALCLKTAFSTWDWLGLLLMLSTIVLVSLGSKYFQSAE